MGISDAARSAAKAGAALSLAAGTIGLTAAVASARGQSAKPAVLHGHTCTVVASGRHRHVVGRAGAVVCALRSGVTLTAVGSGTVYLIGGRGRDKLIASNDPNAHDVIIAGTGTDTIVTGSGGDDIVQEGTGTDSITCGTGASVTVVDDNSQGDSSDDSSDSSDDNQGDDNSQGEDNQDCQGQDQSATLDFEGTVVSATATTMTVQWSDVNDGAQQWLDSQAPMDPNPVTFDISSASIENDTGAPPASPDDVEIAANLPSSTSPTMPVAVDVQISSGADGAD